MEILHTARIHIISFSFPSAEVAILLGIESNPCGQLQSHKCELKWKIMCSQIVRERITAASICLLWNIERGVIIFICKFSAFDMFNCKQSGS